MKKVELYVRSKKQLSADTYKERGCEHTFSGQVDVLRPQNKLQFVETKSILESDKRALEIVSETAKEKGWNVEVYDVSSFWGRIKAHLKGVNETPTLFVNDHKIEGVPAKEQLLSL